MSMSMSNYRVEPVVTWNRRANNANETMEVDAQPLCNIEPVHEDAKYVPTRVDWVDDKCTICFDEYEDYPIFLPGCRHPVCVACARKLDKKRCGQCGKDWPLVPFAQRCSDGELLVLHEQYGNCVLKNPFKKTKVTAYLPNGHVLNMTIGAIGNNPGNQHLTHVLATMYLDGDPLDMNRKVAKWTEKLTDPVAIHVLDNKDVVLLAVELLAKHRMRNAPHYNAVLIDGSTGRAWVTLLRGGEMRFSQILEASGIRKLKSKTAWPMPKVVALYNLLEKEKIDYGQTKEARE